MPNKHFADGHERKDKEKEEKQAAALKKERESSRILFEKDRQAQANAKLAVADKTAVAPKIFDALKVPEVGGEKTEKKVEPSVNDNPWQTSQPKEEEKKNERAVSIATQDISYSILGSPIHHEFLMTVALDIYRSAIAKGASQKGAMLVLAQASLESGWGQSAIKYKDYNLFGVMGYPSKRKTSHGSVKDYSGAGGYSAALTDYFNKIDKTWPDFKDVIKADTIESVDIDSALHTGSYFPTDAERMKGKYAYNADMDKSGKNNYGSYLLKQMATVKERLLISLNYEIEKNNKRVAQINSTLASSVIVEGKHKEEMKQEKETIVIELSRLANLKKEIDEI
jgi:flagellum-specific peptidoglycan hydrolase FlgJ